jgi:hypothetical protein
MLQIIPPHASVRDLFAFAICATGVGWGAQALGSGLPLKFLIITERKPSAISCDAAFFNASTSRLTSLATDSSGFVGA